VDFHDWYQLKYQPNYQLISVDTDW